MTDPSASLTELLADPGRAQAAERLLPPDGRRTVLDRLAALSAELLGAPSAQVSLLSTGQTVVGGAGVGADDAGELSNLDESLCSVTATSGAPLVIEDTTLDERVRLLPPVTSGAVGSYLGVPLVNDKGDFVGALCVYGPEHRPWGDDDVSRLTQLAGAVMAELELAALSSEFDEERTRWELALDAAEVGTFDWEFRTNAVHWDRRMKVVFGLDPDRDRTPDFPGVMELIDPRDRPEVEEQIERAIETSGTYRVDYRIRPASGETRWLAARGRVVLGTDGQPARLLGTAQDITELRTARDEAARLVESMVTGFVSIDREWRITYLNPAGAAIVGRGADELVGQVLWEAYPGLAELEFGQKYKHAVATGESVDFEAFYPHLEAWFDVRAVPDEDGLVLYFHDITQKHGHQEAAEEAARNLRLLARAAEALVETDLDLAIAGLAQALVPGLACWTVVTVRDDKGRFHEVGWAHSDPEMLPALDAFVGPAVAAITDEAALAIVTRTGEPLLVEDYLATRLPASLPAGSLQEQFRVLKPDRILTVPIAGSRSTIGALSLVRSPGRQTWSAEETATAVEIGRRAGSALENARLVREQRRLSETLQNSLLSTPAQSPDVEIAVRYQPAAVEAAVGGDWYDSFLLRDGATKLVVGDVSGHDREAAAAMGQVRALLRGTAYALSTSSAMVLTALDEAMDGLEVDTLATCVLARVLTDAGGGRVLEWSNAGHPPPVLVTPGEPPRMLAEVPELLLGLDATTRRTDHTVGLPDGSLVLLYTDGLVERRDEVLDTGLDRLLEVVGRFDGLPLEQLCDELLLTMAPEPQDDVVLLAVRVLPRS